MRRDSANVVEDLIVNRNESVLGAILGCAVGDAIGLPYEGISRRRGVRLLGEPDRHRFLFGKGMVSDDTQHTWMIGQALCEQPSDPDRFACAFARRLRWWLLSIPPGVGLATLRATLKLWMGISPSSSGVFSAGNGPAMRVAILGAAIDDRSLLRQYVAASTRVTHTDPKAFEGAMAIALAAWCARRGIVEPSAFIECWRNLPDFTPSDEFSGLIGQVETQIATQISVPQFALLLGCANGVSGYVFRTVPVALFAWLRHPHDFHSVVTELIRCGGDTDSTAAIGGAIAGAGLGPAGLDKDWVIGIWDLTKSPARTTALAAAITDAMESGVATKPPRTSLFFDLISNGLFLLAVMVHVLRRALPPY